MFKKKYLAVAGLMALAVVISGCGKKNSGDSVVQATPTPTQETAVTATPTPELINMEEAVEKNVMGEKTSTASKVTIVNKTGSEVAAIYVRETPSDDSEDDEWGDDLVNGMFTLKNGENAVYYYEKGSSSVTYDIRITYSDEEKNECFFRKLPLTTMKQITLRMDGSGDDSIPYATYLTASSTKEVSTLNDVKKRLGLSTDDSDSDSSATPTPTDSSDDSSSSNSSNSDSNNANPTSTHPQIIILIRMIMIPIRRILRFRRQRVISECPLMIWKVQLAQHSLRSMMTMTLQERQDITITQTLQYLHL